jgi:hypothetical protein
MLRSIEKEGLKHLAHWSALARGHWLIRAINCNQPMIGQTALSQPSSPATHPYAPTHQHISSQVEAVRERREDLHVPKQAVGEAWTGDKGWHQSRDTVNRHVGEGS